MNNRTRLRERVGRFAEVLGALKDQVAIVGGTAPALYDLVSIADVRQTRDIDVIVPVHTLGAWHHFVRGLEDRGFRASTDEGVLCRYRHDELIVDVMPTSPDVLGFGNKWHADAYRSRVPASGVDVSVVDPLHFLATKLDAYSFRGQEDPFASHDLEDIFVVLRGVPGLLDEIGKGKDSIHAHLKRGLRGIARRPDALELVQTHLEPDAATQATAPDLLERLRKL